MGNLTRDTDVHWYRFLAAPTLAYTVQVNNVTLWDNDLSLRVFAEGEVGASTNSALHSQKGSTLVWTNTGGLRTYYIAVSSFLQFTTGTYAVAVRANDKDTDGDGIPDAWETLYFGGPTNAVATKINASGVSNWESFETGANPNDPDGALRITHIESTPASTGVRWRAVPYAAYRVESSTNLLSAGGWGYRERVFTGPLAGPELYIDTMRTNRLQCYRVVYELD